MALQPEQEMVQSVPPRGPSQQEHQEGFVLLAVLFMLVLVLLSLSIAAPTVATDLRRDKELETIERGKQYTRAIRLYYRKYGRYPNTIDQLMNTDNQHFLRKRYLDPLTGKDDWRLIHLGEAHTMSTQTGAPIGTPIGGAAAGSTGAGAFGSSSGSSGSATPTSIFGSPVSSNPSGASGTSATGSSGSSIFGSSGSSGSSPFGSSSSSGGTGTGGTGTTGSSAFGTPGATLGGAPIVGVGLPINKASIKTYNKQTRYNTWEFVYDPNQELAAAAGLTGGTGISQTGASTGGTGTMPGIGGNSPNTGTGNSGGFSSGGFSSGNGFGGTSGSGSNNPGTGTGNSGTGTSPAAPTTPFGNSF